MNRTHPPNPAPPRQRLDAALLRELAVEGKCDPRTIQRALAGQRIHGFWLERRVHALLESRGLLPSQGTP